MATVNDVIKLVNGLYPESNVLEGEYDNSGLVVGHRNAFVNRVVCCLDATGDVIEEAISLNAQMIISHHPVIFFPTDRISDDTVLGRKLLRAIENGISVYCAHTNMDFTYGGINDFVAELLGLLNVTAMKEYGNGGAAFGRVGDLSARTSVRSLKEAVADALKDDYVRVIGNANDGVRRVAVINGAGGTDVKYIDMAVKCGADCLVTADLKHHVAVYAKELGVNIIEAQHYTMEHCFVTRLTQTLKIEARAAVTEVEIYQSRRDICPRN